MKMLSGDTKTQTLQLSIRNNKRQVIKTNTEGFTIYPRSYNEVPGTFNPI